MNNMNTRPEVRAILYDKPNGSYKFLLIKAKKGYWQNPHGGIEKGESEIEALIRETKEETGLVLDLLEIDRNTRYLIEYDTKRKGKPIHVELASYLAKADSSLDVKLSKIEEHTDSAWVSYDEALSMLTRYPEQKKVFVDVWKKRKNL